jgi:hypothetical protein
MYIIIRNKERHHYFGRTRAEQETNLRKEWGPTITDEQFDKLKYLEKRIKEKTGSTKNFVTAPSLDELK